MMILKYIMNSMWLQAVLSLITIILLSSIVKGSDVKTNDWSNPYNQHLYSDLTGNIHEIEPNNNNDDTDTRFRPPLNTNERNLPVIDEGYRLAAASEIIAPAISMSINKDKSRERRKRDVLIDNSSISASTLQPILSINNVQTSARLLNNDTDDDLDMSDADADSLARSLSLSASFDGSGSEEPTTETDYTQTETITTIQLTTTEATQTELTAVTETETPSTQEVTETTTSPFAELTSFTLHYTYGSSSGRRRRSFPIGSPQSSTIEDEVANILYGMNVTCNGSCIQVTQNNVSPPDVELDVGLSVLLNIQQRILLVNGLFDNNVRLNDSYRLTVIIIMNVQTNNSYNFTAPIPPCQLCEFTLTGNCSSTVNTTCICYPDYDGQYCQEPAHSTILYTTLSITTESIGTNPTDTGETSEIILSTESLTETVTGETLTSVVVTEATGSTTTITSVVITGTGETSITATVGTEVISLTETVTSEIITLTVSAGLTSYVTTTNVSTTASTQSTAITTQMTITNTSSATTATITTTAPTRNCEWTSWVPVTSCSPSCGTAYRLVSRSCIDSFGIGNCSINDCGGGATIQNESCTFSPPCQNVSIIPQPSIRDPGVQLVSYVFPQPLYFFENTFQRIWVTSQGYISFDTPYYGRSMSSSIFSQISNQAIIAPFWADLSYDSGISSITINWYTSVNLDDNSRGGYVTDVQRIIREACPVQFCPQNSSALQVVQIEWSNLRYQIPGTNNSLRLTFSAYLINTYDTLSYSYPILRAFIGLDYTNLPSDLGYLQPFVGFRGQSSMVLVLNDPSFQQNAVFLKQSSSKSFNIGTRFVTKCDVSYLQETINIATNSSENLNDEANNPRVPCPCTLNQANADDRFAPLMSETAYELSQNVQCYGPTLTRWINWSSGPKLLRSQTCCYNRINQALLTSGFSAGSVLSNSSILFRQYAWQKRITFHDQCCTPIFPAVIPDWRYCRLYYKMHPPSTCVGYEAPTIVTGVGDPHIDTMDSGRYTCHIQGLFVFAQTTTQANISAQYNLNNPNGADTSLIYPDDLFYIYVRSSQLSPALPYVERMQGSASVFTGYTIGAGGYEFVITNNNGKFGFNSTRNSVTISLTANLSSNLNFDYVNTRDLNVKQIYRLKQTSATISTNLIVPRLVLSLWSGVTLLCQIVGENLECSLSVPDKYRRRIEGLAGNFNGDYSDDLVNRLTNQTVIISPTANPTNLTNDDSILSACRSWKVPSDTTTDISKPISPTNLTNWYSLNSATLSRLNPKLDPTIVGQTCQTSIECRHDYIIRINPVTSAATASSVNSYRLARVVLAEVQPTMNMTSTVKIELPFNNTNRNYLVPISISGTNNATVTISSNGTQQITPFNGASVTIPIPTDTSTYVQAFLTVNYGSGSTLIQYFSITACLCINSAYCNYDETTGLANNYEVASCTCPDQYDGEFCELIYNGCDSPSACKINWNNGTTCIPLTADQQIQQGRSYYCNGTCQDGFSTNDSISCEDINECTINSTRCGQGLCLNLPNKYRCDCFTGYKFDGITCIDINECEEPNIDGNFPLRCGESDQCTNTIGNYACSCSPVFLNNGTCQYNSNLCSNDTDTCRGSNDTILCRHGTINRNNACIPWCDTTCPGFCQRINGSYQCNCKIYAGYTHTDNGQKCSACDDGTYGYDCAQSCECVYGTCNRNATNVNESCTCNTGYELTLCDKRIDVCARNNPCNNVTEECMTSSVNSTAECTCKNGYARSLTGGICADIDECTLGKDECDRTVAYCNNTIGSYICTCREGFELVDGECFDIDECDPDFASCTRYNNTYCANTPGSFECRCDPGFALNGSYTEQYGDARSTNQLCLPIDYSSFCAGQCLPPAQCSSSTGNCECPTSDYTLVNYAVNDLFQTCHCPGFPYTYYNNNSQCVNATGISWFVLDLDFKSTSASSRTVLINPTDSSLTEIKVSNILSTMNKTCNESCINVYDTQDATPPDLELLVTLDIDLNITERLALVNNLFNQTVTLNDSYSLSKVRIILIPSNGRIYDFTAPKPACEECSYLESGACTSDLTNCNCFNGYTGYFCRIRTGIVTETTEKPLQSGTAMTNWTVIVAVVSSIGGLLLIISLFMCVYFLITKYRRSSQESKPRVARPQFSIPRAHIPTMVTGARSQHPFDDFSLDDSYDEQFVDASDSFPSSSSTTYNTTYRPNGKRPEADFGIFDELENRSPLSKGHIPRPQMVNILGTLNSFASEEPSGTRSSFSAERNLDDIELVADMVDDMTRDDDIEDEFVEALNPNLAIPRLATQPEVTSSGWFSFFRHA